MAFNYEVETDDEAVRAVAAEISGGGLKPLTDEERAQRERWRDECRLRDQQIHDQRVRAEAAKQEAVRQQAELARRQAHEESVRRGKERLANQAKQREADSLKSRISQTELWQARVEQAHFLAAREQYRQALLQDLKNIVSPPQPPEPTVVYVEPDDEPDRRWFQR
jgi:hypothetical protein